MTDIVETKENNLIIPPSKKFPENYDDFTSSSILEFLNHEQLCLDFDNTSDLDVESLFEEINRLSDNTDERSVDEIIREAEALMKNPSLDHFSNNSTLNNNNINTNNQNKSSVKKKNEYLLKKNLSEESPPRDMNENGELKIIQIDKTKIFQSNFIENPGTEIHAIKEKGIRTQLKLSAGKYLTTKNDNNPQQMQNKTKNQNLPPSSHQRKNSNKQQFNYEKEVQRTTLTNNINILNEISINDKINSRNSATSSPTLLLQQQQQSSISSHNVNGSSGLGISQQLPWSRERTLEKEIEELQEKFKDTEERFQSLRLQHDTLAQQHRCLKENNTQFQEETEKLKLEVQHLSECANLLRTELQNARTDRNEAFDIQKHLQDELIDSNKDKKKLQEQTEKDSKLIQDLQRQCREMERILMRKHPDSVSALIVASKNSNQNQDNTSSRRLLEQRISQLESDAKEQDMKAQKILANVQAKFSSVQSKYETHIADLETQVLSLQEINSKLNEKLTSRIEEIEKYRQKLVTTNTSSQTDDIAEKDIPNTRTVASQTEAKQLNSGNKSSSATTTMKKSIKLSNSYSENTINQNNIKEDAHLLATIRGMRVDLAIKEKAMQRLTRELDECKKTIKKLQKERDTYLKSDKSGTGNFSAKKFYDPHQFSEGSNSSETALKEAQNKIKLLEFDYKSLHEKRLQDLKTLQAAHDRELVSCHETVRILQQRLTEKDDSSSQKRKKIPIDYYALKAKVSSLERRHSEREERLHMLVEALSKGRLNSDLEHALNENRDICQNGQLKDDYNINLN